MQDGALKEAVQQPRLWRESKNARLAEIQRAECVSRLCDDRKRRLTVHIGE